MSKQFKVGEYILTKKLGQGSFATVIFFPFFPIGLIISQVYRASHQVTKNVVAIKKMSLTGRNKKELTNLESEVTIMKGASHKNIVNLLDSVVSCSSRS
jgi:hypothetical protein